jgi:predicted transcriptional regulator of viral defense system
MEDRGATYQICGPNAFFRYGWEEQVPNCVFAYNDRISGERRIGSTSLTLIKVAQERLGAVDRVTTPDGIGLTYSSRVRSLLDAVYDWSRFDTIPRAYRWICEELRRNEAIAANLVSVTLRYGNQAAMRRIGKTLEFAGVGARQLRRLQQALHKTTSPIPWNPTRPKRGKIDRRWGIVVNDG